MKLIIKHEHLFIILERVKESRIEIWGLSVGKQEDSDIQRN